MGCGGPAHLVYFTVQNSQILELKTVFFQNYWLRFAKLQQRLVSLSEIADLLKSQLEATCDLLEPASVEVMKYNKNIAATLRNVVKR